MKKFTRAVLCIAIMSLAAGGAFSQECVTIQDGTLVRSDGVLIETGFDEWGYNYQAHSFNGGYCDAYRDAAWCQPYKDVELQMKWNDAWLSNQDCNGDGLLDRASDSGSYLGSGAWTTNHQKGVYTDENGKKQRWSYFVKIVAAPADAVMQNGQWWVWDAQAQDLVPMGPVIWKEFAVIQEISNDTGTGEHGVLYLSPNNAGFGSYGPGN